MTLAERSECTCNDPMGRKTLGQEPHDIYCPIVLRQRLREERDFYKARFQEAQNENAELRFALRELTERHEEAMRTILALSKGPA